MCIVTKGREKIYRELLISYINYSINYTILITEHIYSGIAGRNYSSSVHHSHSHLLCHPIKEESAHTIVVQSL